MSKSARSSRTLAELYKHLPIGRYLFAEILRPLERMIRLRLMMLKSEDIIPPEIFIHFFFFLTFLL